MVYPAGENCKHSLKTLVELPGRQAIVCSDIYGKIYLYSYFKDQDLEPIVTLTSETRRRVMGLQIIQNLLCVGLSDGTVTLYDMGAPGKEKFTK